MASEIGGDYEHARIRARPVVLIAGGFVVFAVLTGAAMTIYYRAVVEGYPRPVAVRFPEPRLQTDPRTDLGRLTAEARDRLMGYGWVDRDRAIVRVPIDAAMARVVARGAAGFDPVEGPAKVPSPARAALDRPNDAPAAQQPAADAAVGR